MTPIPDVEKGRAKGPLGSTHVHPDHQAEPLAHQVLQAGQNPQPHQGLVRGQTKGCAAKASDNQCPHLGFNRHRDIFRLRNKMEHSLGRQIEMQFLQISERK